MAGVSGDALSAVDAVRLGVRHSPALQSALAKVHEALAEARQTRLLPNPVLSVVVRFPDGGGSPSIEAGLAADLISLFRKPRQINAADRRLMAASADAVTVAIDVVAEVRQCYAAVQSLESQVAAIDDRRKLVDRLVGLARARLGAGESGRLDVLTFEGEQAELEAERIERQSALRDRRLSLARLVGSPRHDARWTVDAWTPPANVPTDEDALVAAALAARPEIQSVSWELAALGEEVASPGLLGAMEGADVGVDAERDGGDWSVGPGASVPLPLFDWGQQRNAQAKARRAEARHRLVQTKRKVVEDVRRAVEAYRSAGAALAVMRDRVMPIQEQRRQRAEESYKAGMEDITAVLVAEQESQASRVRLIELQEKLSAATIGLQRATGGAGVLAGVAPSSRPASGSTTPTTGLSHE